MYKVNSLLSVENYCNKKSYTLAILLVILGMLPTFFSGYLGTNVFIKFNNIMTSEISNIMFVIAILILIIGIIEKLMTNYYLITRFKDYKYTIKLGIKLIVSSTCFLFIIYILLALSASIIQSLGNNEIIVLENKNIKIIYYSLFLIVKNFFEKIFISSIIYYLLFLIKHNIGKITSLFLLYIIYSVSNTIGLYTQKELITTIIFILILIICNNILHRQVIKKKRHYYETTTSYN